MSKQDRQPARTVTDFERKYQFGTKFAEVIGIAEEARTIASEAKDASSNPSENLTHEEVFNLLTKDGTLQGLYRGKDGDLYMNATYIKSGRIAGEMVDASTLDVSTGAKIAGWAVDSNSIHTGVLGGDGSMWLCRDGNSPEANIGTGSGGGWCIGVGGNFGVKNDGSVYASKGSVGGWQIDKDVLYGVSEDGSGVRMYPTGKYFYVSENAQERFYIVMFNKDGVPYGGINGFGWQAILSEKYYTPPLPVDE